MHIAGSNSQSQSMRYRTVFILGIIFLAGICRSIAAPENADGVLRSRAYKFQYMTSSQIQQKLTRLQIGQAFDTLTEDVLIITSNSSEDLVRATGVINVLDQAEPVQIIVLGTAFSSEPLPEVDDLIAHLPTVIVGTMSDAPPKGSVNPGIIDRLGDQLIAIGTKPVVAEIRRAVQEWQAKNPAPVIEPELPTAAEPVELTEPQAVESTVAETETEAAAEETPQAKADTETTEPVDQETVDEGDSIQKSLEEIAAELFADPAEPAPQELTADERSEPQEEAVQDSEAVAESIPETQMTTTEDIVIEKRSKFPDKSDEDDFMDAELLRALEDETIFKDQLQQSKDVQSPEAQASQKTAQDTAAVKADDQPVVEQATEKNMSSAALQRAKAIAAMKEKAEAQAKTAEAAKARDDEQLRKAIEALLSPKEPAEPTQDAEPTAPVETPVPPEQEKLQRELAQLRQQIAELTAAQQTQAAASQTPDASAESTETTLNEDLTEFEKAVGDEMLDTVIDLPQEVQLEALVDLVGKQLGLNYMYDDAILKNQKVLLKIHKGKIKVRDLYALLESVLRFKGFVMTRRDNLVTIMRTGDMKKTNPDPVFRSPDDPIQPGDIIVSSIFQLENIGAATARKTLMDMKLTDLENGLQVVEETNSLIVTDYAYRMERIREALDLIDVAGDPKEFEYRQLKYMQASGLVEKLKKLIAEMDGVSLEVSGAKKQTAAATQTRTVRKRDEKTGRMVTQKVPVETKDAGGGSAAKDSVFIDVDERTNRILMIGTRDDLDTVNRLIDTLDVAQYDLKYVREYVIQHVEAVEVVNVMNELGLASVSVSTTQTTTSTPTTTRSSRTSSREKTTAQTNNRTTTTSPSKSSGTEPNISIRPATNSLLVNATAEQHQAIELVIAHVDVVQKDQRTIREYEIQYVDTQEIIDTMTDLGMISSQSSSGSSGSSSSSRNSRSSSSRNNNQQANADQEASPVALAGIVDGGEPGSVTEMQPQISILEATNSLLVYATPRQHKAISLLIAHADRVPATTTTPYVVYALENQEPATLAETLDQIVSARETDSSSKKTTSAESKVQGKTSSSSSGSNIPTLEEENIRIIPDDASYSLIVYANKRNQQWIGELIRELDEYRPQVLLDCTLVEITKEDAFEYSIDLIAKTYGGSSIQDGSDVSGTVGSDSFSERVLSDISSAGGSVTGFFNSEKIQGVLTALQTNGYGRVMAQPKLMVNDNQEGTIETSTETSVANVESDSTTTNGVVSTNYDVDFDTYEEGVTLTITPHISKGDMLRLEIAMTRKDFGSTSQTVEVGGETYQKPPDIVSTDVTTVATVPDGTTIILGGLESVDQDKTQTKVPLLGDLPIVGGLFRGVDNADEQSRLYVFVKANIIRPGDQVEGIEDIRRVSRKYRDEFEGQEAKFQTMQEWPGIDSKPMEPERVLEDDFEDDDFQN